LQDGELPTNPLSSSGTPSSYSDVKTPRPRHHVRQATVFLDLAGVPPLVDNAHDQKEHARRDSVIDLLDHAAGDAVRRQRENPQGAEAEVADR
jgi:hypothetical protein